MEDRIYNKCAIEVNGYVTKPSEKLESGRTRFSITVKKGVQRKPWAEMTDQEKQTAKDQTIWFDVYAETSEEFEAGQKLNVKGSFNQKVSRLEDGRVFRNNVINAKEVTIILRHEDSSDGNVPAEEAEAPLGETPQEEQASAPTNGGGTIITGTIEATSNKYGQAFKIDGTWYNVGKYTKINTELTKGAKVTFDLEEVTKDDKTYKNVGEINLAAA